ncbi:hypothetical protein CRV15_15335 [Streptomyces clavuligerus]|uniref:Uncharacterized protein n=1 Tax=Streptomyces clavuligerus TaxID=1901 RepID=B5GTE5_STRCL|nr:hypothetical protein D1794_15980 [Streptomyces clavuligerus]EDY49626.1 hypothetical protein SSCG_02654 [Streptomyces clavuligerus]EFG07707.1 Hypothetical protein SCLAV_2635 [Streptomyces clavuligerus]QCS06870.1 hypothetical protein CRV15_15335 [Streptomyces clavuligerus]QPJ93771.1 hypothetical protein GE265_12700 [Streptomyces clavuligerus]
MFGGNGRGPRREDLVHDTGTSPTDIVSRSVRRPTRRGRRRVTAPRGRRCADPRGEAMGRSRPSPPHPRVEDAFSAS